MAFYDLDKEKRRKLVEKIGAAIAADLRSHTWGSVTGYFSDEDTYIRKTAYLAIGRIFGNNEGLKISVINLLERLSGDDEFRIRQTVVNAAGEIGMVDFEIVQHFFHRGLFDVHHSVRNAVIGSVKKMGAKNPKPVLLWASKYLHHPDKEIRREICHGIELRGRTHPGDILPLLKQLQFDKTARVRNTLVHVIGQVAYKKGCLEVVLAHLAAWENKALVKDALDEIIDVHHRYRSFAVLSKQQAIEFIRRSGLAE